MEIEELTATVSGESTAAILADDYRVAATAEEFRSVIDTIVISCGDREVMADVLDDVPAIECDQHHMVVEVEKMD